MALITLMEAQLAFGHVALLDHASFALEPAERVGLIGRNGAGKSSLLKILGGELAPDSGEVETGATVKIGHFSQEGRELDLNQRVYDLNHLANNIFLIQCTGGIIIFIPCTGGPMCPPYIDFIPK